MFGLHSSVGFSIIHKQMVWACSHNMSEDVEKEAERCVLVCVKG